MSPADLPSAWRAEAQQLRTRYANEQLAALAEAHAAELEAALGAEADELLTLVEAVEESGYSERRLREMIADGTIPQAGRKGSPRIRRADLPRRARKTTGAAYDPAADAARILGAA